ncbi:MAG: hypothetical protein AMXMBFR81_21560 [Chthonomonas sp.]
MRFDRYYNHAEITEFLHAWQREHPNLMAVEPAGKSHEGRDIWLVTLTNGATGKHADKPAFYADGNIHASEVSASTAVLHLIHKCLTRYGTDPDITRLLDTRTLYLVPRLNPDGAEWALESPPRIIRSSTRTYPWPEEDVYGLERKDLDGDGRILSMRIPDPNGPWKISEAEPRLMERRKPTETGGVYYRLLPEGIVHNYDGMTLRARRIPQGLDLNRNYPSAWRVESEQHGAGDFPTSEPEVRTGVETIVRRPNICGAVVFHTFSGVNLRLPSRYPDDEMAPEDLWVYKEVGDVGEKMTGYPAISVWHDFKYHPKEIMTGDFDDWAYEHRGIFAWTTEIWSPQRQAGLKDYKYIDWFRDHPFEHDLALLKWSDEKLGGKGYAEWVPFDHPQLGLVEIGGWDPHHAFRNPPPEFLEAEVAPLGDWVVYQALSTPKLEHRETRIEPVGDGWWRVRFAVQNTGWLPTNVTKLAEKKRLVRGVFAEIAGDGSAEGWLKSGLIQQQGPQLRGWSSVPISGFGWHTDETDDMHVFEWVVAAGEYQITAKHDRAGTVRQTLRVPS